ncbi:MAG: MaoC family dehydratase N-terminal domain-containing protein [Nitrospinae bacterium]|nr:MaoC family dehydratase N-terminal domain-containing protein [Nitrospinota bacterium]
MSDKPDFVWENLQVGMTVGERSLTVTQAMVDAHCEALGARREWYTGESPLGCPIAPPMIFINDLLAIYDANYKRFGTIHAKLGYRFHRPVRVGERVHQKVTVTDLYVKREKGWIVSELAVTDEAGELLLTSAHTSVLSLTRKHADDD